MPKTVLSRSPFHKTELIRDAHDESGTVTVRRTEYDDTFLEKAKRARLEGKVKTGDKLSLHDGAEIIYAFSISPASWAVFQVTHPHIVKGLRSKHQITREKAAADLRALHPEWVLAAPGRHHF